MNFLWSILIVPGLIVAYALILRPLLHKIPAMQKFYAEADGFWAKVWAICGRSATIAWHYILGGIGLAAAFGDKIGTALGDPNLDLKQKIVDAVQNNPRIIGYVAIGISALTIWARLRSIMKS
jgi:hypothetical protein